ncbi:LADA_0H15544g1_1 [Lachancea dasiensis]|uniref:Lysophospholipase n=1 Tax=Lachancea dasiensis TaxID=1072105 RepID=A0A1G4K4Y8_9SACH|nr:LADA_0H15544g1_1 [Lachancea dasiensis]
MLKDKLQFSGANLKNEAILYYFNEILASCQPGRRRLCLVKDIVHFQRGSEDEYIKSRQKVMKGRLQQFMHTLAVRQSDAKYLALLAQDQINMGLAFSGGGYRSMLTGSGFLLEMESFGLVDCLNYVTGISGGSWILAKLILGDFKVDTLMDWHLTDGLLKGVSDLNISEQSVVSLRDSDDLKNIFRADDWFYQKLTQVSSLWKRDTATDPLDVFKRFTSDVENLSILLRGMRVEKRSSNYISKFKHLFHGIFKTDSSFDSKVGKLLEASNEIRAIVQFYVDLHLKAKNKKLSGFPLSFTDYWGHALINQIAPSEGKSSITDILAKSSRFQNYEMPLPIFVANCKNRNLHNAAFEFTPFEFGSWTSLRLFIPLKYLGSHIVRGLPIKCVTGFDEISFITGTSSSIFNNVLMSVWQMIAPSLNTRKAIGAILNAFNLVFENSGQKERQIRRKLKTKPEYAIYHPNPFYQYPGVTDFLTQESRLYLVDGGEDGQNIPIGPLLIPERKIDVVFALDSSSDVCGYPNGTMLRNFYRDNYLAGSSTNSRPFQVLPHIPSSDEFIKLGLLSRPVAFGCHLSSFPNFELTMKPGSNSTLLPPIILYHANSAHSFKSNLSTFKLKYSDDEVHNMLQNGRDIFSFESSPKYKRCLACIIVKRAYDRKLLSLEEAQMPFFCEVCYSEYCFN